MIDEFHGFVYRSPCHSPTRQQQMGSLPDPSRTKTLLLIVTIAHRDKSKNRSGSQQIWVMDEDGSNVEPIGSLNLGTALHDQGNHDAAAKTYILEITQVVPPTPGQPVKEPMTIPLAIGLMGSDGRDRELVLARQPVAQALSLDERHDVEEKAVRVPGIEKGHDVGVLKCSGGLDLGEEPFSADDGGELGTQHLERHLAIVAQVVRDINCRHAAGAEFAFYAIAIGERSDEARRGVEHSAPSSELALRNYGVAAGTGSGAAST